VFGNKGYGWKLLAGLAVVALLGVYASKQGDEINPSLWRVLAEPRRWDGTTVWIPEAWLVSAGAQEYEIVRAESRLRVKGPPPGPVGSRITLRAVFRGDAPRLEALEARVLPWSNRRRRAMEIVSVLVLLGVTLNLLRHFAFRPQALHVAERIGT